MSKTPLTDEIRKWRHYQSQLLPFIEKVIDSHESLELQLDATKRALDVAVEIKRELGESLQRGLLFGDYNEPLDDYGKRLIRVILARIEAAKEGTNG